jgi:TnpA family transposase
VWFDSTVPDDPVFAAVDHLRQVEAGSAQIDDAPTAVVPPSWRPLALDDQGKPARRGYTLCVAEQLRLALKRRVVFVPAAERWGDPRKLLIAPSVWNRMAPTVTRALQLSTRPKTWIDQLGADLDRAWRAAAAAVEADVSIRLEPDGRRDRVHLTRLDAIEEAPSTVQLRESASQLLPSVDLPEVLPEVERWTRFARAFTPSTGGQSRIPDLGLSICAVLLAQACNVGYRPIATRDHPALTAARLDYVANTYVRPETLAAANARLVDYQASIGIVRHWGDGTLASADGLRFIVPVDSLHAGRNPKYFATGQGVVFYNWLADTYLGLNSIVLPGTKRDSQYLLDGIVDNPTALEPKELTADTAADSDLIHGLCELLGYLFSPRLADIPDRRFWRLERKADYGTLNRVAANRLDPDLIVAQWPDVLRVAGTLHTRAATASEVIRALQRNGQPTPLARAIGEIGRAVRTNHHAALDHRRRIPAPHPRSAQPPREPPRPRPRHLPRSPRPALPGVPDRAGEPAGSTRPRHELDLPVQYPLPRPRHRRPQPERRPRCRR